MGILFFFSCSFILNAQRTFVALQFVGPMEQKFIQFGFKEGGKLLKNV
jgi:hypothetical protein